MEKNLGIELEVVYGYDNDNKPDFDKVSEVAKFNIPLPEEQRIRIEEIIDESKDIDEVRETLEKAGYQFSVLRQGEITRIFIQDKEIDKIRALHFNEALDEVERSEEVVPDLWEDERKELAKKIREKKISKEEVREQYGEKIEDRDIDEEIDRNTLDFKDEVRLNQMLFEAPDIYAVNDVLETYGLEKVREDRPYIIEHKDGYETGMKIVFGQETRVINEIATEGEKQAMLACNDIEQLDNVIKHTRIDRHDKRSQERTDDEDYRRDVDGVDFSATRRNGWEYEGPDR